MSHFFRTDNNQPFTLANEWMTEKRNEKAVVGIALSRKKDSLLSVNRASFFWTRIDIGRIFNSFFFERQQCFIWMPDTIWVLSGIFSPCPSTAAHMGIQRVQQRSQWQRVTGRTKSQRIHLPDSEQHRETLSVSLFTLSASPLLMLVNMHASNIQQNQAWAFVSVLRLVLYYAMIESQNCLIREAESRGIEPLVKGNTLLLRAIFFYILLFHILKFGRVKQHFNSRESIFYQESL